MQGNMAGTGGTGAGMKLTDNKIFPLVKSTMVHHSSTNGLLQIVDCQSALGLNSLMVVNSAARFRKRSGIFIKGNRK